MTDASYYHNNGHNDDNEEKIVLNKTTPISFIERYCSKLNINQELTKLCRFVCINVHKKNLIPENTPQSTSAGVIYFISQVFNLNITKQILIATTFLISLQYCEAVACSLRH